MRDHVEQEFEADLAQLEPIGKFIVTVLREFGLEEQRIFHLQLAVDEACSNIIKYGYATATAEENKIMICCSRRDGTIAVEIKDNGKPFDPMTVASPHLEASLEERQIGGLGIYFMKKVTDAISYAYTDGQNVLTLVVRC
ncbi:MAG TPA: ATP-binding protein [Methanomicrobia archaeon]|nr:ATP-binding protein [Methanomicrobia archaeon]